MFIKISPSIQCLPLTDDDDLTSEQENALLEQCPTINLHKINNKEQISQYLMRLFAYYFQISPQVINLNSNIVDDIERHVWAKELGVAFDDVTYGRLFCSQDDEGNAVGGLEDRGMMIATMYMTDFPDLVGIKEVRSAQEATFEAEDDEFGSYFDCETLDELSDLIYSVCKKLNN
ncbi:MULTISPECIES: hypothetical protein [unclassified Shewanella]|uniref:hypothetical protein n=1 Tax=unclassified Shewanella TaxID=196818 RepID=UPI000C834408|nr:MULTISPECIES: hypothetical protein [unclassified Shewanella]MDO6678431.1 hypothetical protein [Shewanella sp. 4_MG-2023]PMH96252.1 hypothetical protein BCU55_02760 [Shewanella sp. 10N.286.48.A6]